MSQAIAFDEELAQYDAVMNSGGFNMAVTNHILSFVTDTYESEQQAVFSCIPAARRIIDAYKLPINCIDSLANHIHCYAVQRLTDAADCANSLR